MARAMFTLLWKEGAYQLSRNFRLQSVGDVSWLRQHYDFDAIAYSIDELVVLNVERGEKDMERFALDLRELTGICFIPVAAGGGIRRLDDAHRLLRAGADKLVVNTPLFNRPDLVSELVRAFGSQCVVASIDYSRKGGSEEVFTENGSQGTGLTVEEAIARAQALGAGEIYLTAMDRDGTGQGLDLETVRRVSAIAKVPVIASGGAGRFDHLAEGITRGSASAVSTANLFNFLADGLTEARTTMRAAGIPLATWSTSWIEQTS